MKISSRITSITLPLLLISSTAMAGDFPGTGGVVVDLGSLARSHAAASGGVAVPIPHDLAEQQHKQASAAVTPKLKLPVTLIEAAAEEEQTGDAAFKAIVEAMTPREAVQPLKGKRFTFYLSEKVAFAQLEQDASRLNVKNGRVHLATLYSEQRDSVIHTGLALDASLASSFRLSFGSRVYIALLNTENTDAFAGALGIEAAYNLPFKALPLEFAASIYYAPDILTFGASDRAIDAQIDFTFPLRKQSALFAGARFLQVDTRPEDREIDNRVHMGIRWDFM